MPTLTKSEVVSGTSSNILHKMEQYQQTVQLKLNKYPNAEILQARCSPLLDLFKEQSEVLRLFSPNIDQLKGLVTGLGLAVPMILQHNEILKQNEQDKEKLRLALSALNLASKSVQQAQQKQREELLRSAGKLEGMINAAMSLLQKVEVFVEHYEVQKRKQEDLELEEQQKVKVKSKPVMVEKKPTLTSKQLSRKKKPKKSSPKSTK